MGKADGIYKAFLIQDALGHADIASALYERGGFDMGPVPDNPLYEDNGLSNNPIFNP